MNTIPSPPETTAPKTVGRRVIQATLGLAVVAVLVRSLGLIEKLLLAYFFGTGIEVDAYLVAYSLPFSAYIVLRDVVGPAFLPAFLQTERESERDAWRLFRAAATWLLVLLGGLVLAGVLAAGPLVSLSAPGFGGEQQALAVRLTRLAMPALALLGLSALTTAALQAHKRFTLPALAEATFRAAPLVLFLALGRVEALVVGVVGGALGKLGLESAGLRRTALRATGGRAAPLLPALDPRFPPLRTVGRLAAPLLVGLSLSLFGGPLVDNAFASQVGVGGVSALAYARKIGETLTTILPYTLGLVLFPFSAEMAATRDGEGLARMLTAAIRALAVIFVPVTIGLALLREPFVRLLLERGAFGGESTQLTIGPLLFYALGLLPFALEIVVVRFFYARQDTLTPVLADVAAFALNVSLIPPLMAMWGLGGIAAATAVAKTAKVVALLVLFGRRVPGFAVRRLGPFAGQIALAALAAAAVVAGVRLAGPRLGSGPLAEMATLAAAGLLGGGAFAVATYLLKVEEMRGLVERGRAWLSRQ